jgi:selenocysteine lyase/cysteine desulfurase
VHEGAKRFEFWESNIAGKLGLGQAVRNALDNVGIQHIFHRCQNLGFILIMRLNDMHGIHVHHDASYSCGIVTFSVRGVDAAIVKDFLWTPDSDCRLEVSVVPATSRPLDSARYIVPDLVRASLSYTNSIDDIEVLCKRLAAISIHPELQA